MARTSRQSKILELINKKEIDTQEELVDELRAQGYDVTQATISRDIKELGLIKVMSESKKYKYALEKSADSSVSTKMTNMFREAVISVEAVNNLIVLRTLSGSANSAGMMIDKLNLSEVMGCVAGDDTLLIICRTISAVDEIVAKINTIIN